MTAELLEVIALVALLRTRVARRFPHDPTAFTQGLAWDAGVDTGGVVESTGGYGTSDIRRVRLEDGQVLARRPLPETQFGEGVAVWGTALWHLTWREGVAVRRDRASLEVVDQIDYDADGWGATSDGDGVWTSDGSPVLTRRRASDLARERSVEVSLHGVAVHELNDLTVATTGRWAGLVWANVLGLDALVAIDTDSGEVVAVTDARALRPDWLDAEETDLNGIAWVAGADQLLVTGKWWPYLYLVDVVADTGDVDDTDGTGWAIDALLEQSRGLGG